LAIDALLTTLHPLFENVLQTVCRKLQDSETDGFGFLASELPFYGWKSPEIAWGRDLDSIDLMDEL